MVTTRYSDQQGSKSRQKVMRLLHEMNTKKSEMRTYFVSKVVEKSSIDDDVILQLATSVTVPRLVFTSFSRYESMC